METVRQIQALKYEQLKTYEEIQAELGLSSKTIAKALWRPEEILEGYQRATPTPRPVLGPFEEKIEELLRGKDWSKEQGRKVRRTVSLRQACRSPGARRSERGGGARRAGGGDTEATGAVPRRGGGVVPGLDGPLTRPPAGARPALSGRRHTPRLGSSGIRPYVESVRAGVVIAQAPAARSGPRDRSGRGSACSSRASSPRASPPPRRHGAGAR